MKRLNGRWGFFAAISAAFAIVTLAAVSWDFPQSRTFAAIFALVAVGAAAGLALGYGRLCASLPKLEGSVIASELSGRVTVLRDAHGVATVVGATRPDVAWATGYLHAQERFFQMDLQRRTAAGELCELLGAASLDWDRGSRVHRFRSRATAVLAAMTPMERQILEAYVAGVNRGLNDLRARPFEYLLLRSHPAPWTAEDTVLTIYAMYLGLQEPNGTTERCRCDATAVLGKPLVDFLFPEGTSWDSPLDGSLLPTPDMPTAGLVEGIARLGVADSNVVETKSPGSNCFAVGGRLSVHGAAIVANDMHLTLRVPNIWYRARLKVDKALGAGAMDITGITLPGAPSIVAGSNGRVAWGFSNSCVDTSDVVVLESPDGDPNRYRTPDGPKELDRVEERLYPKRAPPRDLVVEESIWGPVIGTDPQGRKLAYRWIAHDPGAVNLRGLLGLECAQTVNEALAIARDIGIPHQNLIAGDADGSIGWTTTNILPRRFGHDGRLPTSWSDGSRGWNGYLAPEEMPVVQDPENSRIWTANARVVGGLSLAKLGFGSYAHAARARQILTGLLARERFTEEDLLGIQLDDRALLFDRWRQLMIDALGRRAQIPECPAVLAQVENWGGRAIPESVGYRLVRTFRAELIAAIYRTFTGSLWQSTVGDARQVLLRGLTHQVDEPAWRLLTEQPGHLVPPGYRDWEAVIDAALSKTLVTIKTEAKGRLHAFTWGSASRASIRHPLSRALPVLSTFLDPANEPLRGDIYQPRVAAPGFGSANRFVVAPGREASGIFHMPTGQSGHPLSPYYNLGHEDWATGRATPFLPGETKWRLAFSPGDDRVSHSGPGPSVVGEEPPRC